MWQDLQQDIIIFLERSDPLLLATLALAVLIALIGFVTMLRGAKRSGGPAGRLVTLSILAVLVGGGYMVMNPALSPKEFALPKLPEVTFADLDLPAMPWQRGETAEREMAGKPMTTTVVERRPNVKEAQASARVAAYLHEDLDNTGRVLKEALHDAEAAGDNSAAGWARLALGEHYLAIGALDEAEEALDGALMTFTLIGDGAGSARTLVHKGLLSQERGALDEAADLFEAAISVDRGPDGDVSLAGQLRQRGLIEHSEALDANQPPAGSARVAHAVPDLVDPELALLIAEAVGDTLGAADARLALAAQHREAGDLDIAEIEIELALIAYAAVGDRLARAAALEELAKVAADAGDEERGWTLLREAADLKTRPAN